MKDLDRRSPGCRVPDKTSPVAPVLNLHTEFVVKIAAVDHLLHLQLLRLVGIRPTLRETAGCVAAASSPSGVGLAGLSEGRWATMKA